MSFAIRPAQKCPSCGREGTLVSFIAADGKQGYWRLSALTQDQATQGKTLFGGTSFALRAHLCNYCSYVMLYYDESVTWPKSAEAHIEAKAELQAGAAVESTLPEGDGGDQDPEKNVK